MLEMIKAFGEVSTPIATLLVMLFTFYGIGKMAKWILPVVEEATVAMKLLTDELKAHRDTETRMVTASQDMVTAAKKMQDTVDSCTAVRSQKKRAIS